MRYENRNTKKEDMMKTNSENMSKRMNGESVDIQSANPIKVAEANTPAEPALREGGKVGRFSRTAQILMPALIAVFLLVNQFVESQVARWSMVGLSFAMILVPLIHNWIIARRKLTLNKALKIMSACGLDAKIKGNEILWRAGGQINVLRMNGPLIQLSRDFELEGAEENVRSMEKAATETMREVSLAKVIVTRQSPNSIGLSFLTEAFCSSPKTFSEFLPAYIQVLDVAEERQRVHFIEVKPERRRIGFNV